MTRPEPRNKEVPRFESESSSDDSNCRAEETLPLRSVCGTLPAFVPLRGGGQRSEAVPRIVIGPSARL